MDPLISVVVPVYNVEKYIDRCIISIVEQTYKNLEIILVDDGSPDKSGAICDEWAKKDSRIVVYHKHNGGTSDARNFGVERAQGELLAYVDSDDYVLPEYIEYLYRCLDEHDADISCCDLKYVYADDRLISFNENESLNSIDVYTGEKSCYDLLLGVRGTYYIVPPCKLYKKSILEQYPFPVGRYFEDEATNYKLFYSSRRVTVSNKRLYAYYQNLSSAMHTATEEKYKDCILALTERTEFFKSNGDRAFEIAAWDGFMSHYIYRNVYDEYDKNKRLKKEAFVFASHHWFNGDLSFKAKLKFILYAISPRLYKKVISVLFE